MGQGHSHHHVHLDHVTPGATSDGRDRQMRVLAVAFVLNAVLLVAELVGGIVFGSLALLADAAHMLTDVVGLGIALVSQRLMLRPRTPRHTFGLLRAEALGAQANGVLLVAATGWIGVEAVRRLGGETPAVEAGPVLVIAVVGLAVNVASAVALARTPGRNLNIQGALAHMASDALGSVGAIVAALSILWFDAIWVDAVASALIAVLVLVAGWRLLAATTRVLMEAAPAHLDRDEVRGAMMADDAVDDVHHLHLWSLSSDTTALSAHVVLGGELDLHQAQQEGTRLRERLLADFGISHVTLELECHLCEDRPQPDAAV